MRAAIADDKISRDSIVAAQEVFRNEMAAAAERRRQFNAGGMRGVGSEIQLNPDRGATVAESAAGAALVNPDAGYTELPAVAGPPYQPDEAQARSHLDEGADEEKDEGPQQEAKSSGGFGRIRKAVGDFFGGSMSPGRRPTARVLPIVDERDNGFAPPDYDVLNIQDGDRMQAYNKAVQYMQGRDAFDMKITPLRQVAKGLDIRRRTMMSREQLADAVKRELDRQK
jgi:hypothetical protein